MSGWIRRATVVDGTTRTGIYAEDGSNNVVVAEDATLKGIYHPCGAFNVTSTSDENHKAYADDGSYYIHEALIVEEE